MSTQTKTKSVKSPVIDAKPVVMPSLDSVLSRVSVAESGVLNITGKLSGPDAAILCEHYGEASETGKRNGLQVLFTVFDQNGRDRSSEPVKFVTDYLSRTRAGQSVLGMRQTAFNIIPSLVDSGLPLAKILPKADFLRNVSSVLLIEDKKSGAKKVASSKEAKAVVKALEAGASQAEIKLAAGRVRKPIKISSLVDSSKTPSVAELFRRAFDAVKASGISQEQMLAELNKVSSVKINRTFTWAIPASVKPA